MIDVHIAHLPGERKDWWEECERSLDGQPVTIYHTDGVIGDVRQARFNGYNLGSQEYVSYVDPDDRVLPGAFATLLSTLQADPSIAGAYSMSNRLNEAGEVVGLMHPFREYRRDYLQHHTGEIHQLAVVRRDIILRVMTENWDNIPPGGYAEIVYHAMVAREYDWKAVNHVGYEWRVHNNGAHLLDLMDRSKSIQQLKSISDEIISGSRRTSMVHAACNDG